MFNDLLKEIPAETLARIIPAFIGKMIQNMPVAHRTEFSLNTISSLMNHGTNGMSEEEKKVFKEKIQKKIYPLVST